MKTEIRRWGNSLALRIPRAFAAETALLEGSAVDLSVRRGRLVVAPERRKKYHLADLLRDLKPAQLPGEQFTDDAVGKEIW